jgi:hypothetical protein
MNKQWFSDNTVEIVITSPILPSPIAALQCLLMVKSIKSNIENHLWHHVQLYSVTTNVTERSENVTRCKID